MIKLTLPYPVSANRYWQSHVPKGWARAVVHRSKEADAFREKVGWLAKAAGFRQPTMNPIEIGSITLVPPATVMRVDPFTKKPVRVKNGTRLNIDNCLKVTFDALNEIVYVDDKQIERICGPIGYGEPTDPGALIIEIRELETAQTTLFGALAPAKPDKAKRAKPLPEPVAAGKEPF